MNVEQMKALLVEPAIAQLEENRRKAIVALAKAKYERDGELEIDHNAQTSEGDDNGCYVAAWIWVSFEGTQFDKEKGEDEAS